MRSPFALFLLLVLPPLVAQRPPRTLVESGPLGVLVESGLLQVDRWAVAVFQRQAVVTEIVDAGGLQILGDSGVLLSGRKATGAGSIEYWSFSSAGQLQLEDSVDIGDIDPVGVAWLSESGRLALLPATGALLWMVDWTLGSSLPGWEAWTPAGLPPNVAANIDASDLTLRAYGTGSGERLSIDWALSDGGTFADLAFQGSSLVEAPSALMGPPDVLIDEGSLSEGRSWVGVTVPPATAIEVVRMIGGADVVLGSASSTVGGSVVVPLLEPVEIGGRYTARRSGSPSNIAWSFVAGRRYGQPGALSDGRTLGFIHVPETVFTGCEFFRLLLPVRGIGHSDPASRPVAGAWTFNLRIGGVDPVQVDLAGSSVLTPAFLLPGDGIYRSGGDGIFWTGFPIPDDPALAGLVGLFQAYVFSADGASWGLSEVLGVKLGVGPSESFLSLQAAALWANQAAQQGMLVPVTNF